MRKQWEFDSRKVVHWSESTKKTLCGVTVLVQTSTAINDVTCKRCIKLIPKSQDVRRWFKNERQYLKGKSKAGLQALVDLFNNQTDDYHCIYSDNKHLNEKIDEAMPFHLALVNIEGENRIALVPEYSGPVPKKEFFDGIEAELCPLILPIEKVYVE